jgi:hypothetical protein
LKRERLSRQWNSALFLVPERTTPLF